MHNKDAAKAIDILHVAIPDELGNGGSMWPAYLRGQAYLQLGQGKDAASEFRKLLENPGIVVNWSTGALARLGLARAYAVQGDNTKTRTAYLDFLNLWKDADPCIPILKQAKAEYARLQ
jgi:predicted Zn-dependent protease